MSDSLPKRIIMRECIKSMLFIILFKRDDLLMMVLF